MFWTRFRKKYQFNFSSRRHQMVELPISCCCQQQMPTSSCLAKFCATNPLSYDEIQGPANVDTSSFEGGASCCQNDVEIVTLPQRLANVDLLEATNHFVVPSTSAHRQRRFLHPALIRFRHFTLFQFHSHWIPHQHL